MNTLWIVYACGATLSLGFHLWAIYTTLHDGTIRVESDNGLGMPWQMFGGMLVAALGAAAIWPLTMPLLVIIRHMSQKEEDHE